MGTLIWPCLRPTATQIQVTKKEPLMQKYIPFLMGPLMPFVLLVALGASALAQEEESCVGRWKDTKGSLTMALRSNACHFWVWAQANSSHYISPEILQYEAFITGDPHHENFSHIEINPGDKRVYVLNDIDDTGHGAAILDLLKFLGVSRSIQKSEEKLKTDLVLKNYIEGLKAKDTAYQVVAAERLPELLRKDFQQTSKEILKMYQKKSEKNAPNGHFDPKENKDLRLWEQMDQEEKQAFQKKEGSIFWPAIYEVLKDDFRIIDRATAQKENRHGILRYIFSLVNSKNDKRHILEFKPIKETSLQAYKSDQLSSFNRAKKAFKVFWPEGYPGEFGIYGDEENTYLMRPKYKKIVNFEVDELRAMSEEFAELTYFIAYHLGQMHGKQPVLKSDEFVKLLEDQFDELVEKSKKMTDDYLKGVKALHKK